MPVYICTQIFVYVLYVCVCARKPKGPGYGAIMELGLKDHIRYGFWGKSPYWYRIWTLCGCTYIGLQTQVYVYIYTYVNIYIYM